MNQKLVTDRSKWNTLNLLMMKGTKDGCLIATVAGVPHLASPAVEWAAAQLRTEGKLSGVVGFMFHGSHNYSMTEKDRDLVKLLMAECDKDPAAFKEKTTKELDALRDVKRDFILLTSPGMIFTPDVFKGGGCKAATWLYVARAHARGKVHLKGKTYEEQADLVQKFVEASPAFCVMAGISWTVDTPEEIAVACVQEAV